MRIRTSSLAPGLLQRFYIDAMERVLYLIPPKGILYDDLKDKAYRMYRMSPESLKELVADIISFAERRGIDVIVYNSPLMIQVSEKVREDIRKGYRLLKR